jgi:hypothetical protein
MMDLAGNWYQRAALGRQVVPKNKRTALWPDSK